ncbi:beta-propeller domain-containing protein [Patescibacteria group bacterium]|nr:beta-propeller domain-containing protein [Patescibacteria group bacterium]
MDKNQNLKNNGDYKKNKNRSQKNLSNIFLFILFFVIFIAGSVVLIISIKDGDRDTLNPFKPPVINEEEKEDLENYIKKFNNYSEMQYFMNEKILNVYGYLSGNFIGGVNSFEERRDFINTESSDAIEGWGYDKPPTTVPTKSENPISNDNYSKTNVQVYGVDEGDIVKNDGKYIYTISGNEVVILDAYPAENSKEVSRIKVNSSPSGIYINNNKLLVYGQNYSYNISEYKDLLPQNRFRNYSYVKIYDISDRTQPTEIKSYVFEGNLSDSRMIGDYVYLVTANNSYLYKDYPVPLLIEDGKLLSSNVEDVNCYCPDVYYFDNNYYSYNLMTVSAINLSNLSEKLQSEAYLLDEYQNNIFVSFENLYITFNKRVSEEELTGDIVLEIFKEKVYPLLSEKDKETAEKIEKMDEDTFPLIEKQMKLSMMMMKYENIFEEDFEKELQAEMAKRIKERYEDISKELEKTVIHKIGINKGDLKYKASGEVTGIVLNQFSMDENNGYFRIATTKNSTWSSFIDSQDRESYSNLYVLDEKLKVVGQVEELARGERIYSVRFMQNRAYMVTFKQTDPLFVIGLDDPTKPTVLGELKVPGFSSYLHPYDETTLIGLGKESDENGRITGGVKLSLFDVSDVSNPIEIDKYVMGDRDSNSIAINEHKAFLFSKDKNLLVIPVSDQGNLIEIREGNAIEENMKIMPPMIKYFNGIAVFNISKKGFELKGKIDHSNENSSYSWNNVSRGLYIDDVLYSLSNQYLKANRIDNLDEIKTIKLTSDQNESIIKP